MVALRRLNWGFVVGRFFLNSKAGGSRRERADPVKTPGPSADLLALSLRSFDPIVCLCRPDNKPVLRFLRDYPDVPLLSHHLPCSILKIGHVPPNEWERGG